MSTSTLIFAVLGAAASVAILIDFFNNHGRGIKRIAVWLYKQVIRLRPDSSAVTLHIPPPPPAFTLPVGTTDGVTKTPRKYIMFGGDRLFAYTITREGFPGTRFLVVRNRPGKQPQSIETPNRDAANDQWNKWYQEWKQKGFDGASGTGLSGEPPFGS